MELNLDGPQHKDFVKALVKAFPNIAALGQMVTFGLSENLNTISGDPNIRNAAFELVRYVEAQGRTDELLIAARNEAPKSTPLRLFAEQFEYASTPLAEGELEAQVIKSVRFKNTEQWREQMSLSELPVCRVETPTMRGTGFLVGPDLVMTNHHVMARVIETPAQADKVVLRFDYKKSADGSTLRPGQEYGLAPGTKWLVDDSPVAELDYALLRVKGAPAEDEVGGQQGAPPRGFLKPVAHSFEKGEPLFIIQHPSGAPLKISAGSVTGLKPADRRVAYSANTENGSSGSPCFTFDWDVVALHHYGETVANRGVIFSAILDQPKIKEALGC